MKQFYLFLFLSFLGCSSHQDDVAKQIPKVGTHVEYFPFKNDLYINNKGQIAFKVIDWSDDPLTPSERFLTEVWNADTNDIANNGKRELRDVIDTGTFQNIQGIYYKDINYIYVYSPMSDGGTFAIFSNIDRNSFKVLSPSYAKDRYHAYHWSKEIENADVSSFGAYPILMNHDTTWDYAKDKSHYYYFGEPIKMEDYESHNLNIK